MATSRELINSAAPKIGCSAEDLALDVLQYLIDDDSSLVLKIKKELEDLGSEDLGSEDFGSEEEMVILNVSDWSMRDKIYEAPLSLVKEFKKRMDDALTYKSSNTSISKVWEWWSDHIDFNRDGSKPVKFGEVNMNCEQHFFFDYNNPEESLSEWEIN